jgi:hypothetical protein
MPVFTVHEPPRQHSDALKHVDRFVFVRDGFSWPAFLFGPLWMLRRRLWLALLSYVVVMFAIWTALRALGSTAGMFWTAALVLALFLGFEGPSLRRWRLKRRGWKNLGVVVGDDLEAAERRFFDRWIASERSRRRPLSPTMPPPRMPTSAAQEVVGLFPEPGVRP